MVITDDGLCQCKQGFTLNSSRHCQLCHILNCERCADNDSNICEKCLSPEFYLFEGLCVKACTPMDTSFHCISMKNVYIAVGVVGGVILIGGIVLAIICYKKKRNKQQPYQDDFSTQKQLNI